MLFTALHINLSSVKFPIILPLVFHLPLLHPSTYTHSYTSTHFNKANIFTVSQFRNSHLCFLVSSDFQISLKIFTETQLNLQSPAGKLSKMLRFRELVSNMANKTCIHTHLHTQIHTEKTAYVMVNIHFPGNSLVVQRLGLSASAVMGPC